MHDAPERVLLMELHVGVSVTVLTPDDDAPDGNPAGEIACRVSAKTVLRAHRCPQGSLRHKGSWKKGAENATVAESLAAASAPAQYGFG